MRSTQQDRDAANGLIGNSQNELTKKPEPLSADHQILSYLWWRLVEGMVTLDNGANHIPDERRKALSQKVLMGLHRLAGIIAPMCNGSKSPPDKDKEEILQKIKELYPDPVAPTEGIVPALPKCANCGEEVESRNGFVIEPYHKATGNYTCKEWTEDCRESPLGISEYIAAFPLRVARIEEPADAQNEALVKICDELQDERDWLEAKLAKMQSVMEEVRASSVR